MTPAKLVATLLAALAATSFAWSPQALDSQTCKVPPAPQHDLHRDAWLGAAPLIGVAIAGSVGASHVLLAALVLAAAVAVAVACRLCARPRIYCVESEVFVPSQDWQVSHDEIKTIMRAAGFDDESLAFQCKTLDRSGTGQSTHWPPVCSAAKDGKTDVVTTMRDSRDEAEAVVFPIVQRILEKTGTSPRDVDFLIVNCSLFTPTPSLCAMICHKFGLRQDVRSYNLGGMGCSANVISVDLAKQLLENSPGSRALVVSTEIITPNLYRGSDKSMMLQNTLFRCGGVALLLSSRRQDASRAKYELVYTGRVQLCDDQAAGAVVEREDAEGNRGVALSKDIVAVAGRAMKANFTQLGRQILPFSEKAKVACSMLAVATVARARKAGLTAAELPKVYTPDFSKAVDHFCIHAGGRAVIDGVQKKLGLSDRLMRPSRKTLEDWGNTSSSSIWYEAEWIERFEGLREGQQMLQISFGSGFKCNSAVWRALRVDASKRGVPIKPVKTEK